MRRRHDPDENGPAFNPSDTTTQVVDKPMRFWQKTHRYLGLLIGIQLLLWTLSGLVFSFSPIEMVRGEHLVREADRPNLRNHSWIPIEDLDLGSDGQEVLTDAKLRVLSGIPVYELTLIRSGRPVVEVWNAATGNIISPIDSQTAKEIALADFAEPTTIKQIERIEKVGAHSEYRGRELPAYRIELNHDSGTVIYVSEARGTVVTRRNSRWRWFDFLWMLHTMDYQGRDHFNHWPLKLASILGVATVVSGFSLSLTRTRWFRKRRQRRGRNRASSSAS